MSVTTALRADGADALRNAATRMLPIGETGKYINGVAFKPTDWSDEGIPIVRIQNLTDRTKPMNRTMRVVDPAYVVQPGDLLVSWSATLDAFIWEREPALLNQHIFKVVPNTDLVSKKYLFFALRQAIVEMGRTEHLHGSTMKHINRGPFLAHRIPVPPLRAQAEIVAELEKQFSRLDEAVANLKRVKANLSRYKAAVLAQLTTGTASPLLADREVAASVDSEMHELGVRLPKVPSHWKWTTVGSIGSVKGGKRLPAGHAYAAERTPYPYVRVTDFRDFGIDTSDLRFLSEETHREIQRYTISANDVYVSIAGSIGLVGQVPAHLNNANLTENAAKITCLKDFEAKYLVYWLASPIGRQLIAKSTIATTQSKLALFRIEKLPAPLPPLDEQRRIVVAVDHHLSILSEVDAEIEVGVTRARVLKAAVLNKTFGAS